MGKDSKLVKGPSRAGAAFLKVFKVSSEETIGNFLCRLGNGRWSIPEPRTRLEATLATGTPFKNCLGLFT